MRQPSNPELIKLLFAKCGLYSIDGFAMSSINTFIKPTATE